MYSTNLDIVSMFTNSTFTFLAIVNDVLINLNE